MKLLLTVFAMMLSIALVACGGGGDGGSNGNPDDYYFWGSLGNPGVGWITSSAIAIDPSNNKPVIVFTDHINGGPHVMRWSDGTSWTDMGLLTTEGGGFPSLTLDPFDNKPVVVFQKHSDISTSERAQVKKWSGGTFWTDMGFVSTGAGSFPSIAIDPSDNKPIVTFVDVVNGERVHVKKWSNGTSWIDLGFVSTGTAWFSSLAIDKSDNKPIVAFVDGDNAHVKKWSSGTSWSDLGFPSTNVDPFTEILITVDPSDNKPIVAFGKKMGSVDSQVQVKKWSGGTSWIDLGNPSWERSDKPSITIDPSDNKPIVAFRDWANPWAVDGNHVHVVKWSSGTSWVGLGYPSEGPSFRPSIAIDPSNNKPIVMFIESNGDGNIYVTKHP